LYFKIWMDMRSELQKAELKGQTNQ
jgi:hypothetical protein